MTKRIQLTMRNFGPNSYKRESGSSAFFNEDVVDPVTGEGVGGRQLTIISNAFVTKLIFHPLYPTRVIGVKYVNNGVESIAFASKEVILSAGTFNSAALLLRSGIGNCTQLASIGVPCIVNSPYVGQNLVDNIYVQLAVRAPSSFTPYIAPLVTAENTLGRFTEGAVKTSVASQFTDYTITTQTQPDTKLSWGFGCSFDPSIDGIFNLTVQIPSTPYPLTGLTASLMRPNCKGSVTIADGNPSSPPVIYENHLCADSDLNWARQVYQDLLRIANSANAINPQFQVVYPTAYMINNPTTLDYIIKATAMKAHHPTGTNRMGNFDDIQQGVVSGNLCVHGTSRLRVVDASIFPSEPSQNIQASIYGVAAKAVSFIKSGLAC